MALSYEKKQTKWKIEELPIEALNGELYQMMFGPFPPLPYFQACFPGETIEGRGNSGGAMFAYWAKEDKEKNDPRTMLWYVARDPDTNEICGVAQWDIHYAGKENAIRTFPKDDKLHGYFENDKERRWGQNFKNCATTWRREQIDKHINENVVTLNGMVTKNDRQREGAGTALMAHGMETLVNPMKAISLIEASPAGAILYKEFGYEHAGFTESFEFEEEFKDRPSNGMMYMYRPQREWTMEQTIEAKKEHRKELAEEAKKEAA